MSTYTLLLLVTLAALAATLFIIDKLAHMRRLKDLRITNERGAI